MYQPKMENKMAKIRIENKTSVELHGLKPNGQIEIEADKNKTPLDKHWRRRLRDESIIIIKEEKITKKKGDK